MTRLGSAKRPPGRIGLWVGLLALVIGMALGWGSEELREQGASPWALGALTAVGLAAILVVSIYYWRAIDEAAREAHKWAWFWGGSAGLLAIGSAIPVLLSLPEGALLPSYQDRDDAAGWIATGLVAGVFAQAIGYGVAWLAWWARRR